jgi:hypothetical protein
MSIYEEMSKPICISSYEKQVWVPDHTTVGVTYGLNPYTGKMGV